MKVLGMHRFGKYSFLGFCVFVVVVLVGLGFWQVQRLAEKNELLQALRVQSQSEARLLQASDFTNPPPEFTRVTIKGRFSPKDNEIFLLHSRVNKEKIGYGLVRILHSEIGAIAVDLGWVSDDFDIGQLIIDSPDSDITIDGIIRKAAKPSFFTPSNDVVNGDWYWIDPTAMASVANIALPSFYISSKLDSHKDIANNHLQYALTWFALALTIAIMAMLKLFFGKKA